MEKNGIDEQLFRLNRKVNFKGEKATEYTVRGNSIEEIKERDEDMKKYLEE